MEQFSFSSLRMPIWNSEQVPNIAMRLYHISFILTLWAILIIFTHQSEIYSAFKDLSAGNSK